MDCVTLRVQPIIPRILWMDPPSIISIRSWMALAPALPIYNLRDIIDWFLIYNVPWIMNGACAVTSDPFSDPLGHYAYVPHLHYLLDYGLRHPSSAIHNSGNIIDWSLIYNTHWFMNGASFPIHNLRDIIDKEPIYNWSIMSPRIWIAHQCITLRVQSIIRSHP
jgi:hypothetical protein